ncbi:MAG: hypothetical protein HOB37_13660 [Rhodospirillaceae bacterium]|nr:hypothetical protein [Rhodospirillaceae bacterium]
MTDTHHNDTAAWLIAEHQSNPYRRSDSPEAIRETRATWWRISKPGNKLPAEQGLIVIQGGRP